MKKDSQYNARCFLIVCLNVLLITVFSFSLVADEYPFKLIDSSYDEQDDGTKVFNVAWQDDEGFTVKAKASKFKIEYEIRKEFPWSVGVFLSDV